MLIIDKKADIQTISHLGASETMIRKIFLFEGWMISSLGAIIGLFIGIIVYLIQEHFGIIKLGSGTEYILSAYPVAVQITDILFVLCVVLGLGAFAAWIPAKQIKIRHENS